VGNGGRVQWVSGRPGEAPAYAGTDFIIAHGGRIAAVALFFDKLYSPSIATLTMHANSMLIATPDKHHVCKSGRLNLAWNRFRRHNAPADFGVHLQTAWLVFVLYRVGREEEDSQC
jgi:hypothetical protein